MVFSQRCQYALRLSLLLAGGPGRGFIPVGEAAEGLGVPGAFLSKVSQDLVRAGLLQARRGPGGGVAVAGRPESIRLLDIVEAVDGREVFHACLLGLPGCGVLAPCPLHNEWTESRARLRRLFADTTLAAAASGLADGAVRLAMPQ